MPRKIVLLEANEIPWRIYDEFCVWRPESRLARLLPRCRQFTTVSPDAIPLSPWITWPTLHRGVSGETHGIKYFGETLESVDAQWPPIWKLLVDGGVETGVFGPIHSYPLPSDAERYSFYVPDTFAASEECYPDALTCFQRFNLSMTAESTRNVSTRIDWKTAASFLARAPGLGLRASTALAVVGQLIGERRDPWRRVRRRTFQPVLAFDLFLKQLRATQPAFSNFFTNHVASSLHRYWAATFPDEYDDFELGEDWVSQFKSEIEFTMTWADRFFGDLVDFVDAHPEYVLLVTSSMGQAAVKAERVETMLYIQDLDRFMQAAGVAPGQWSQRPAMAPKVSVCVEEEARERFATFLSGLELYGEPANFEEKEAGFFNVGIGNKNVHDLPRLAKHDGRDVPFDELGLDFRKVEDEAGSTAYHIPQGTFFVYDPQGDIHHEGRPELSATEVAPDLLAHSGLEIPDYMDPPSAVSRFV
jgi:hypothetical protein